MQLYIIPTYECNLNCLNCYSKKYCNKFQNIYLSWSNFISLFKRFKSSYNNYSFIGGEPTLWKFINEAILFLQNKRKIVNIFTNGVICLSVFPNNIILNGNNLFDHKLKKKILQNLEIYQSSGLKIRIRFNIDRNFTINRIDDAIQFSVEYADSISLAISYPIETGIEYGRILYLLSKKLAKNSIVARISRATPLCLFKKNELEFLKKKSALKGICNLPSKSLVINPDSISIQPCVEIPTLHKINELEYNTIKSIFEKDIKNHRNKVDIHCTECKFYYSGQCCGGCLPYKFPESFFHNT